jgi:repressor LexA
MDDSPYLAALQKYWKQHKVFPSMSKLAGIVGMADASGVFSLLSRLIAAGYLKRIDGGCIGPGRKFFARPLIGSTRAGRSKADGLATQETINIDEYLIEDQDRTTFLNVRGDSMIGAGLLNGDIAVVLRNAPAQEGDMVVARLEGQWAVRYLAMTSEGNFFLESANPAYEAIHPTEGLEVLGLVVGLVRRYRT